MNAITPSAHAVERFHERVRPALTSYQAAAELFRLMVAVGELSMAPPAWARRDEHDGAAWILLGPDIALPVEHGMAITCIARSGYSEVARDHRTRAKRRAQQARRAKDSSDSKVLKRERKANRAASRRWEAA